jgi:DNA-binding winged helix-turn-helix (wHTH) protein
VAVLDALIASVERAGEVVTQRELISPVWPHVTVEGPALARFLTEAGRDDQIRHDLARV